MYLTNNIGGGMGYNEIQGFEATFSPPSSFIGWPDETLMFGVTGTITYERIITEPIIEVSTCVPTNPFGSAYHDFEYFKFRGSEGGFWQVGSEENCEDWDVLSGTLIGFHTIRGYYSSGNYDMRSVGVIVDSESCESATFTAITLASMTT